MEKDDGVRSEFGIVSCLRQMDDGSAILILDDVRSISFHNPTSWKFSSLYTWNKHDSVKLENLKLSEKEYAKIGENLIIRLLPLNGKLKD